MRNRTRDAAEDYQKLHSAAGRCRAPSVVPYIPFCGKRISERSKASKCFGVELHSRLRCGLASFLNLLLQKESSFGCFHFICSVFRLMLFCQTYCIEYRLSRQGCEARVPVTMDGHVDTLLHSGTGYAVCLRACPFPGWGSGAEDVEWDNLIK